MTSPTIKLRTYPYSHSPFANHHNIKTKHEMNEHFTQKLTSRTRISTSNKGWEDVAILTSSYTPPIPLPASLDVTQPYAPKKNWVECI